jgi:hypothetical protein
MRLSQKLPLLEIIISPSLKPACVLHTAAGRGVLIFSDFLPLGMGKEGGENH